MNLNDPTEITEIEFQGRNIFDMAYETCIR